MSPISPPKKYSAPAGAADSIELGEAVDYDVPRSPLGRGSNHSSPHIPLQSNVPDGISPSSPSMAHLSHISGSSANRSSQSSQSTARRGSEPLNAMIRPRGPSRPGTSESQKSAHGPNLLRRSGQVESSKDGSAADGNGSGTGPKKVRQDQAMAKWRQWASEQNTQETLSSRPSSIDIPRAIPLSNLQGASTSSSINRHSPHPTSSSSESDPSPFPPVTPQESTASRPIPADSSNFTDFYGSDIYNTDSIKALQDVELAVDQDVLAKIRQPTRRSGHVLSTLPRFSPTPNPFVDIAHRLTSRKIRPIFLELIQSLAHYIDAVWYLTYPDTPCPWISPSSAPASSDQRANQSASASLSSPSSSSSRQSVQQQWTSKMIAAVQKGKAAGLVANPSTLKDMMFWQDEVEHGMADVNEIVGQYKLQGWAFHTAIESGKYGRVEMENVVGVQGQPGGLPRLLNDLEEVIWGDAKPRDTDLAYLLPEDFNPYAPPLPETNRSTDTTPSTPPQRKRHNDDDEAQETPKQGGRISDDQEQRTISVSGERNTRRTNQESDVVAGLNLAMWGETYDQGMSLHDIGKKRHDDWVAKQQVV